MSIKMFNCNSAFDTSQPPPNLQETTNRIPATELLLPYSQSACALTFNKLWQYCLQSY